MKYKCPSKKSGYNRWRTRKMITKNLVVIIYCDVIQLQHKEKKKSIAIGFISVHINTGNYRQKLQYACKWTLLQPHDIIHHLNLCSNDGVFDVALHVHVQVYSNGKVTWTPPAQYCSSCGVQVLQHAKLHMNTSLGIRSLLFFFIYIFEYLCIGGIFPFRLAELQHEVPLLHLRLNGDRPPACTGLQGQGNTGDYNRRILQRWGRSLHSGSSAYGRSLTRASPCFHPWLWMFLQRVASGSSNTRPAERSSVRTIMRTWFSS